MKDKTRFRLSRLGNFLEEAMPFMVLFMVIFFGLAITHFQGKNRVLLENTKTAAQNTEVIIKNLAEGVEDIKNDNQRNTEYLNCLLAAHDLGTFNISNCKATADSMVEHQHTSPEPQPSPAPSSPTPTVSPSQTPSTPPTTPDNDGIIVDLPLLPVIHIPSPF